MLPSAFSQGGSAVEPLIGAADPLPACPVVAARDATYTARGYRSFEFATFEAHPGRVLALVSSERNAARDLVLALGGLVRPTSGSLVVDGVELAAAARRLAAPRLPRGLVGLGVCTGLLDVDGSSTVEEAVLREMRLRGVRSTAKGADALEYLAEHHLATHADQGVSQLPPLYRARLSAALACAGGVRLSALDLGDPFTEGLTARDARRVVEELGDIARADGICVVVALHDVEAARAADDICALDIQSAEALAGAGRAYAPRHFRSCEEESL